MTGEPDASALARAYARSVARGARRRTSAPCPIVPAALTAQLTSALEGLPAFSVEAATLWPRLPLLEDHLAAAGSLASAPLFGGIDPARVRIALDGTLESPRPLPERSGPAGVDLHGFAGSCARTQVLLRGITRPSPAEDVPEAAALVVLVDTLAEEGYADRSTLLRSLPASLTAGLIDSILTGVSKVREIGGGTGVEHRLREQFEDLLDVCDWLASQRESTAFAMSEDYELRGNLPRARRLVQDQLARNPTEVGLLRRYGHLSRLDGDLPTAEDALREALALAPGHAETRLELAQTCLDRLDIRSCTSVLAASPADDARALALQARAREIARLRADAVRPGALPQLALSPTERASGRLEPATRALAIEFFREHGVLQIDNVFPPDRIAGLQAAFVRQQARFLDGRGEHGVLGVGHGRFMLSMVLDEDFGSPDIVCSGVYLPLMQDLLGADCILGAYTAVVSMPGSGDQSAHKDHSALFEEHGWRLPMPSFAAQVVIPLMELNAVTGATCVFKGSQQYPAQSAAEELQPAEPLVPLGSCLLIDYSIAHYGRANVSSAIRPILNLVYCRPWFRDCRNYHLQPPLKFSEAFVERAPPQLRRLIEWWALERRAAMLSLG